MSKNLTVSIYCGYTNEEWSPKSEKTGVGGSEEAVINMARLLAKNNKVTVYNRCGDDEGTYDKVKYENYEYFDDVKADVVVFWRQPSYVYKLKDKHNADQVFLWLHDTVPEEQLLPIKHFVDGIFVLSGFHASLYPNLRDKLIRTRNGIKLEDVNVERNPYKIVYGSSYDRGLKELLEMWGEIKAYEKRAELHIFYGMSGIKDEHFKDEIKHLLKQQGVVEKGRISHEEVAKEFASAGVWAYPCWFPEISCITAMKAQAYGAIPVITPTAALLETVKWGLTTREPRDYKGDMPWGTEMPSKLMDQYIRLVRKALDPEYQKIRDKMEVDFSWEKVAKSWENLWLTGKSMKKK